MFAIEPERTRFDLHFAVAGYPVRIHPFFWLSTVSFGLYGYKDDFVGVLIWVFASLISITIHELGHALAYRRYGLTSRIVLYGMGGLCIANREVYREVSRAEFPWNRIFISFAGPLAGFVFAALVVALVYVVGFIKGSSAPIDWVFSRNVLIDPQIDPRLYDNLGGLYGLLVIRTLFFLNIFWGLINLLPVYPLDGGQIARSLFQVYDQREPLRNSLILSMVAAVAAGLWGAMSSQFFLLIMFLMLAFNNYQELQIASINEEEHYR